MALSIPPSLRLTTPADTSSSLKSGKVLDVLGSFLDLIESGVYGRAGSDDLRCYEANFNRQSP
jgi:hypothetical protein